MNKKLITFDRATIHVDPEELASEIANNKELLRSVFELLIGEGKIDEDLLYEFAVLSGFEYMLKPLIYRAFEDDYTKERLDELLPKKVRVVKEKRRWRADYEGHPDIAMALNMLLCWIESNIDPPKDVEPYFEQIYPVLREYLENVMK